MFPLRAKITHVFQPDGRVLCQVEWCRILPDATLGEVMYTETLEIAPERSGCAFVSRVSITEAEISSLGFTVDENGKRHFTGYGEGIAVQSETNDAMMV